MPRLLRGSLLLLELAGAAAIVDGIGRVSIPAALMVAGLLAIGAANLADRLLP